MSPHKIFPFSLNIPLTVNKTSNKGQTQNRLTAEVLGLQNLRGAMCQVSTTSRSYQVIEDPEISA